ncbi:MAG: PolC-type DNA polymerase III [Clostridiales bacterium]|jgi:DNA polymerase-3 subunit alpha (Gram-positive type)|nr:PolC-type DNA polymerase III [Clostridiales bacterium]
MDAAPFTRVFSFIKPELAGELFEAFEGASVASVSVDRRGRLTVNMESRDVIREDALDALGPLLRGSLDGVTGVEINLRHTGPLDLPALWANALWLLSRESPLCGEILRGASFSFGEASVTVGISGAERDVFSEKRADKYIEEFLSRRAGRNIAVKLGAADKDDGGKPAPEPAADAERRERLIRAVERAMAETPAPSERPERRAQPRKYQGQGQNPRKSLKITDRLKPSDASPLSSPFEDGEDAVVCGSVLSFDARATKTGQWLIITADITDSTDSITIKFFARPHEEDELRELFTPKNFLTLKGAAKFDSYSGEISVAPEEATLCAPPDDARADGAPVKRVELHLHTQMSAMDATNSFSDYARQAARFGHKAIALTDHGVVQAFPEAMSCARKYGLKVLYGVEAYLVDDLAAVVTSGRGQSLDCETVVFDLETTGLKPEFCKIIEIGAVRLKNGEITEEFSTFVDPEEPIPASITDLTGITGAMVKRAPKAGEALKAFLAFAGEAALAAHNASFDAGFISFHAKKHGLEVKNTVIDTLGLSRALFPELKKHKLNLVAEHLGVPLKNHHRAADDAAAAAGILRKCAELLKKEGVQTLEGLNVRAARNIDHRKLQRRHAVILVKNQAGIRNLYELVSIAHLQRFYKKPLIAKSDFIRLREGLLIGSACEAGEFYKAVLENAPEPVLRSLLSFYDYLEIQPTGNNMYLVRDGIVPSAEALRDINRRIIEWGREAGKPVVATGDVHFLNKEDEVFRRVILYGEGFKDADLQPPLYYRTTEEMLAEFDYLGPEAAEEVVIRAPNRIADMIEEVKPIPDGTFPPEIEGAEEQIREMAETRAKELYGDPLPPPVGERLQRELDSIIKNGFSVMYLIAQKLVQKSVSDGYLVGSRGSVGSSFAATMAGITEVNPLSPHYVCPECRFSDFDSEEVRAFAGGSGCDMPDKTCPACGAPLAKEGHDIPFETFLGFDGDKEPDIDLNFSGEYQARAHAYTEELFGEGHVFKAGTIGTLADKTAYGYVRKYSDDKGLSPRRAELNRLKAGCTGIKRTTGQHPGGLMILPRGRSIYEFCPVQRPANDSGSSVTTTHFDYHSISGRLLKLDILGHDVPTIIRMLHDLTGVDPTKIDLGDKSVMSLFTSPEALGVSAEDINCRTGSLGLPEFGTGFVRQMLLDTRPNSFAELVRISGLSHGTDVWLNNAQDFIKRGDATLKTIIPTRDDIMIFLIHSGLPKKTAFKIMENVRKGKGLPPEQEEEMRERGVPEWYIESCKKIKYLFPKGHAVAYVMMSVRIGWYKVYEPLAFYAATFSTRAADFDYETMCFGREKAAAELRRLASLAADAATAKDKATQTTLELVVEMYARGLKFAPIDLYRADASKFTVTEAAFSAGISAEKTPSTEAAFLGGSKREKTPSTGGAIMAPLCAIPGLGGAAAQSVTAARENGEFATIEDFANRTKVNKTVLDIMRKSGVFGGMSETNQLTLF